MSSIPQAVAQPASGSLLRLVGKAPAPMNLLREVISGNGSAVAALRALKVDIEQLRSEAATALAADETCPSVLINARREAQMLSHNQVDQVHVLLALLYRDCPSTASLLGRHGVTMYDLRTHLQSSTFAAAGKLDTNALPNPLSATSISPVFLVPLGAMVAGAVALLHGVPASLVGLATILFVAGGWIVSVCIHEYGHAACAYLGGDRSVLEAGYLSFNPLKYANPLLSVGLPLLFVLLGGIGLPGGSVRIDTSRLRSRGWDAAVSAAGPLATLLFTIAIASPFFILSRRFMYTSSPDFWAALAFLVLMQISALVLNLLPIPPLDGFGILSGSFSDSVKQQAARFGNFGLMILFFLLWQDGPISDAFWKVVFVLSHTAHVPGHLIALGMHHMTLMVR